MCLLVPDSPFIRNQIPNMIKVAQKNFDLPFASITVIPVEDGRKGKAVCVQL